MLLDTEAKTVTFKAFETLTLEQLWNIVYILEPEETVTPAYTFEYTSVYWCEINLEETSRYIIEPEKIFEVESFGDWNKRYAVVKFTDRSWGCSCPDWQHRKQFTGEYCKHMLHVLRFMDL